MVLESTMICLDNSDWMRNGDYAPSRFEAQQDAAGVLCNDRLNNNPENTVGLLTMAGQGVDLLASPTEESGKILACFSQIKMGGKCDFTTAVQIAQLALKHRKNKNGGQRIIVFVGAPVSESPEALLKLGKQLKKNNVAIDIICVGEQAENEPKLQELVNAANTNDNSHLVVVPLGSSVVNTLASSPILFSSAGFGAMGGGGGGGDDFDIYGGIDPNSDPELAMAIRISQEEARAQEEARLKAAQQSEGAAPATSGSSEQANATGDLLTGIDEDDEEALMRRALEMSMRDLMNTQSSSAENTKPAATESDMHVEEDEEEDEDEELQRALALSVQEMQEATTEKKEEDNTESKNKKRKSDDES